MNILSIDTTSPSAGAVIMKDGVLTAEFTVNSPKSHSVNMLMMIDSMMKCSGITIDDIDLFACCAGPGSFTGVRIGASIIKGLAMPRNIPAIGVSTIEAMANGIGTDGLICPVMNARRSQVYTGVFLSENGCVKRLTKDAIVPLVSLISLISGNMDAEGFEFTNEDLFKQAVGDKQIYFTGDGYEMAAEAAKGLRVTETLPHLRHPGAAGAAIIAGEIFSSSSDKSIFAPENLMPVYLRKPQAEREYEERLAKAAETKQARSN